MNRRLVTASILALFAAITLWWMTASDPADSPDGNTARSPATAEATEPAPDPESAEPAPSTVRREEIEDGRETTTGVGEADAVEPVSESNDPDAQSTEATPPSAEEIDRPENGLWIEFGPHRDLPQLVKADWETLGEDLLVLIDRTIRIEEDRALGYAPLEVIVRERDEAAASLERFLDTLEGKIDTQLSGFAERNHPLVISNLVAFALDAAGQPITNGQVETIETAGELSAKQYDFLVKKFAREKKQGKLRSKMQRFLDELEVRGRFDATWKRTLNPTQRAYLYDERTAERWRLDPLATESPLSAVGEVIEVQKQKDVAAIVVAGIEKNHPNRAVWDPRGGALRLVRQNDSKLRRLAATELDLRAPRYRDVRRAAEAHAQILEKLPLYVGRGSRTRRVIGALLEDPRFRVTIVSRIEKK